MTTQDLLLELGCEDLPARYVMPLADALSRGIAEGLSRRGVGVGAARTFATPRRIAVLVSGVASTQPDQVVERTGPSLAAATKDGQPTPAALGFARSCGVEFSALGSKDGKLHFAKSAPGAPTVELLPAIFEDTLKQMDEIVPKRMRWGDGDETFVRPVAWILALLGGDVVPLERFGLVAGRRTYGHRFHAPDAIDLRSPAEYESALKAARVWADVASRKAEIRLRIEAEARRLQGHARITEDLLDEVTALVEWPVAISGTFEERFLELPPEVIVATVETNQRYFTLFRDADHKVLTNRFITVSNIESRDVSQVITGNERVVRPRLTDALFFWQQDLKQPLAAYAPKLDAVTFQKDLGSTGDKVRRVSALAASIAKELGADVAAAERAAALCKADLVTRMVYEFPELQGIMGGYYAAKAGESADVASAIREHYLPAQQGTPIPSTKTGQVLSLADKLDSLAGIFAAGLKPTASKDPFGLRRAALGIVRILVEGALPLDLAAMIRRACDAVRPLVKTPPASLEGEIFAFVQERLASYSRDQGYSAQQIESVLAQAPARVDHVLRRMAFAKALSQTDAGRALAAASKRVGNILKAADGAGSTVDPALLKDAEEIALNGALATVAPPVAEAAKDGRYLDALPPLASLKEPVDAYFEKVMVNADDARLRANRLAMLRQLHGVMNGIADISKLAI